MEDVDISTYNVDWIFVCDGCDMTLGRFVLDMEKWDHEVLFQEVIPNHVTLTYDLHISNPEEGWFQDLGEDEFCKRPGAHQPPFQTFKDICHARDFPFIGTTKDYCNQCFQNLEDGEAYHEILPDTTMTFCDGHVTLRFVD